MSSQKQTKEQIHILIYYSKLLKLNENRDEKFYFVFHIIVNYVRHFNYFDSILLI